MILASTSTSSRILFAASSSSKSVRSCPPVMLINTPRAPLRLISSSNGFAIAFSAAWIARSSPSDSPVPIIALPISSITARTSAKSRFINPGRTIRSVTPLTPWYNTSSAMLKASVNVVFSFASRNKFWFGMIISVSTIFCKASTPSSAWRIRFAPSNWKGFVTTPTVRTPSSLAACAMIGAAPVPVPPPIPAVIKHICAPAR